MYDIVLMVFIFMIVLFCYVHIYDNYNTSNDLEVYEIDKVSKDKLEEICNLKQPFLNYKDEKTHFTVMIVKNAVWLILRINMYKL